MRLSASDSVLNNGAQSQQKNEMFGVYKNEIYLIKTWMIVFAEMKTNEEKKIYEKFLGKEVLSRKRERKGDFRNVVMDLHL